MIFEDEPPNGSHPPAARIAVKAVPGSRKDQIVGRLGDRLKIKVAAPPEAGRANDALCRLLAQELRVKPAHVQVIAGHTSPEKVVRVVGLTRTALESKWPA